MHQTLINKIINKIMSAEDYDALALLFNTSPEQMNKKIKGKKQAFLIKHQLFTVIYQKKGQKNFDLISENIKLIQFSFGENIIANQSERSFNYILKGSAMLFVVKPEQVNPMPLLYKRIQSGEYFGQKSSYGGMKLHSVKSVSKTYVLQLSLQTFYKAFSGHFTYHQLKQKVDYLEKIWIFNGIGRHERQRILLTSRTIILNKNSVLFREEDQPQCFYLVLEGELTLFHQKQNANSKKYSPFLILTEGQICGVSELYRVETFQYVGVCTTATTKFLCVSKKLFEDLLKDRIPDDETLELNCRIKKELMDFKSSFSYLKSVSSLNFNKTDPKPPRISLKKKQRLHYLEKMHTQPSFDHNEVFNIREYSLSKRSALKNRETRELLLSKKKQQVKVTHNSMRISSYTNSSFTYDKQLLLGYLVRKQRQQKLAERNQTNFRNTQFHMMKQLSIEKSSAIKNQKRKLKKSRRNAASVPNLI